MNRCPRTARAQLENWLFFPPLSLNAWLRYDLISRLLRDLEVRSILEIGVGEGALGARLATRYEYVGVELDQTSFRKARSRIEPHGEVLHGDLSAVEPERMFDLVCAFEVLEHIEDDVGSLREWRDKITPGGWLLLSVPAYQRRFGPSDVRAGHYRRYDPDQLPLTLQEAEFEEIELLMYGFPLGYLLELARNWIARRAASEAASLEERTQASGRWLQPPASLGWATALLCLPFRILQRPFVATRLGTGIVAVARRPG